MCLIIITSALFASLLSSFLLLTHSVLSHLPPVLSLNFFVLFFVILLKY